MKKFKFFLFAMIATLVGVVASSCSSNGDNEEELGTFNHCSTALAFKNYLDAAKTRGNYLLVDYRSKAEYDAGHIPGAVWLMEGNVTNMSDGTFCKAVYEKAGNMKTYILLYGPTNFELSTTMGGQISKYGYGKTYTYVLMNGYSDWSEANASDATSYPIEK